MGRVLCAWELGHGYGHIGRFLSLARVLRERGHDVVVALKDLSRAESFLGRHGFTLLQAPVWFPETAGLPPAVSYPEILFRFGYLRAGDLRPMVRAWRELFDLVTPDLLMLDHAPTALVAARGTRPARALIGNGFESPARVSPLPSIRPWLRVPEAHLLESERRVVGVVNGVLDELGAPRLDVLADLFQVDEDFLCTFPELDPYPERSGARYWGAIFEESAGAAPAWPDGGGAKVFAYLSPGHRDFDRVLRHLAEGPARAIVHAPGATARALAPYRSASCHISHEPLEMARVTAECDLVVCNAGHGTVAASLLAGRPVLMLPIHLEQRLTADDVARHGAGVSIDPDAAPPSYRQLLKEMLGQPRYAARARAFTERHGTTSTAERVAAIADRCDELLAHAARPGPRDA